MPKNSDPGLIDDLKAAHEAASAQLPEADFHSAGWHRRKAASERLDTLMRQHAGEIIAALGAAQWLSDWGWGDDATARSRYADLRAALIALEGKS